MVTFSGASRKHFCCCCCCNFLEILMVSDKMIHRAFRTPRNLYQTKPIWEIFHFHCLPKLYIGFNSKSFNPNQTGGGGVESTPPSTFRAIISQKFFPAHRAFVTFFFRVLRNFWCYFRKNRAYRSEVTQHYVIERRLKIWEFSGFVYKTYGKCFLC